MKPRFLTQVFQQRCLLSGFFRGDDSLSKYYRVLPNPALTERLQAIDRMKIEIAERRKQTNGNLTQAIQDRLRFLWTYHSNAIEGSKLTLGDTIFFLQEGLTVGGKPLKDFVDAKNHSEAIDYLRDVVKGDYAIDCHLLRSMNALLLKGVDFIPARDIQGRDFQKRVKAGEYKTDPNYVIQPDGTIHEYVEPYLVDRQLTDLCEWINGNPHHAVITAAVAHYNMVRIHPFQDGNGRGSRLLMNLILIKQGYNPAIIEVEKRAEYLASLKEADKGNLVPFTYFIANTVQSTQEAVLAEINKYLSANKPRNSPSIS